jgi:phosphonate transport system substrate-binding protein
MGARPGFFASVVEAGFHQRAIRLVASGRVDAAAIDSQVLAVEFRDHPQVAASLRVIGSFGPSTIQPVVAASGLPEQLKTAVREMLLGLGGRAEAKSALAQGLVEGFVAIGDRDYDDIRAMLATIHAAGYTTLR